MTAGRPASAWFCRSIRSRAQTRMPAGSSSRSSMSSATTRQAPEGPMGSPMPMRLLRSRHLAPLSPRDGALRSDVRMRSSRASSLSSSSRSMASVDRSQAGGQLDDGGVHPVVAELLAAAMAAAAGGDEAEKVEVSPMREARPAFVCTP